MNKAVAFLIPIYPPHFKFARNLIESWKTNLLNIKSDLWFVFTNIEEKKEFDEWNHSVVLPESFVNFSNNGIINIKKFYGLHEIKDKYEYVIVLDAESAFIKKIDLNQVCETYWNNKVLYGNNTIPASQGGRMETVETVKNSCKRFFPDSMKQKLESDLYLCFNQPCIYKCSTLNEFFSVIDYEKNAAEFIWHDFDYYIYMYYLILYQGFRIEDMEIESNYGICEAGLDYLWFKSNKYEKINIWMCSQVTLPRFDNPNLFIVCHIDRDEGWMLRVTNIKIDNLVNANRLLSDRLEQKEKEFVDLYARIDDLSRNNDLYARSDDLYKRSNDLYARSDEMCRKLSQMTQENLDMRKRIDAILNSKSYLLGRMFTWLPRKIIRGLCRK